MVRKYLQHFDSYFGYDKKYKINMMMYIVTSNFHYNRVNLIARKILDIQNKWILGDAKLYF